MDKQYSNLVKNRNEQIHFNSMCNDSSLEAVADSGTTGHYITPTTPCTNKQTATQTIPIKMPNGEINIKVPTMGDSITEVRKRFVGDSPLMLLSWIWFLVGWFLFSWNTSVNPYGSTSYGFSYSWRPSELNDRVRLSNGQHKLVSWLRRAMLLHWLKLTRSQ